MTDERKYDFRELMQALEDHLQGADAQDAGERTNDEPEVIRASSCTHDADDVILDDEVKEMNDFLTRALEMAERLGIDLHIAFSHRRKDGQRVQAVRATLTEDPPCEMVASTTIYMLEHDFSHGVMALYEHGRWRMRDEEEDDDGE